MSEFKMEDRYLVFKRKNINKYLTGIEIECLEDLARKLDWSKKTPPKKCVIVESDWPEYETVWEMIKSRVIGAPSPVIPREKIENLIENIEPGWTSSGDFIVMLKQLLGND